MDFGNLILPEVEKSEIGHTLACNDKTSRYQLHLTSGDVQELIVSRREKLRELELVELKEGILPQLVESFADSPYLFQDSYVNDLDSLQYLFYRFKGDRTDEEMLELMRNAYDNICQGSMNLLVQHLEGLEQEAQKAGKKVFSYLEPDEDFVDYTGGLYGFEELLPVLMRVARLYMDDTSLSYNDMRRLMSGVTYSIKAGMAGRSVVVGEKPDAGLMYKEGQHILNQRFKKMREMTQKLFGVFCDYHCEFIKRSVFFDLQRCIAGQDIIRTPHILPVDLEYPVLLNLEDLEGVDKAYAFVEAAKTEWEFLAHFNVEVVCRLLERYMQDYKENFYENVSEVVLLQALGCIIADQDVAQLQLNAGDIDAIRLYFEGDDLAAIQKNLENLTRKMLAEQSGYFLHACRNLAVRIENGIRNDSLGAVFSVLAE